VVRLTLAGAAASAGAAWYSTPVSISAFTTDFNFQLLSAKADGFTFAIQNVGTSAIGPLGSGLGYGASHPGGTGGIAKSVAVKFDIYNNNGETPDSTGVYNNGASPTVPSVDMTPSGVMLNNGHVMHAHITYNGTNLTLLLTDTTTSASFTTTTAINIPSVIGSGTAFVGFTGGTGGLTMTTDIVNWTLTTGAPLGAASIALPSGVVAAFIPSATAVAAASSTAQEDTAVAPVPSPVALLRPASSAMPGVAAVGMVGVSGEPTFSPKAGYLRGDTEVALRCDTPGTTIHYTVDSSQPTADSPVYTGPISVKGAGLTIKAFSSMPGRRDSPVVTGVYRIPE
ncbi:MAG: secreted agglutinin, partial [Acidobacteriaceae bacterium]|nr:secreted agglutinin [Acidobacteriaceae bacterium]